MTGALSGAPATPAASARQAGAPATPAASARHAGAPATPAASARQAAVDRLLVYASRAIVPLAALAPIDARAERERLTRALRADQPLRPQWQYPPPPPDDGLRAALDAAEALLVHAPEGPLDALYAERIRELALEAAICAAAGSRELGRLATARFAPRQGTPSERSRAAALCARWLSAPERHARETGGLRSDLNNAIGSNPQADSFRDSHADSFRGSHADSFRDSQAHSFQGAPHADSFQCNAPADSVRSDGLEPGSLLQRMRAEVAQFGLPFAVRSSPALAALAATGEDVILVATGRTLTVEIAARTVLHEVHGHAWPRVRARHASSVLFRAGTAGGADDQEGRALWLEHRAGWLGQARKRQLAARHDAACTMERGATFGDVVQRLVRIHEVPREEAIVIAERVFRGSDGTFPGLGRERAYLPAWLRVRAHLLEHPDDDAILAAGQIAVGSIQALRRYAPPLHDYSAIRLRDRGNQRERH